MTADELAAMEAKAIAVCDADGSGCVTWAEVDQCEHDHVSCFRYLWYLIKVSTKFREIFIFYIQGESKKTGISKILNFV